MLQVLDLTQKNIIATRANDVPGKNDYQKIQPLVHNIISQGEKVRWYFEMEEGVTPGLKAFLKKGDTQINHDSIHLTHAGDMEKIALVGSREWEGCLRSMMNIFTTARIQYFDLQDRKNAIDWIKQE